jgi:hypothetical protein
MILYILYKQTLVLNILDQCSKTDLKNSEYFEKLRTAKQFFKIFCYRRLMI